MKKNDVYHSAVKRNLYEASFAFINLKVLIQLEKYIDAEGIEVHGENLFSVCVRELYFAMFAHIAKVLEPIYTITEGEQKVKKNCPKSFWYILDSASRDIENLKNYSSDKIKLVRNLSPKVKHIRDKTLFHLDERGVLSPSEIWKEADIKANHFREAVQFLFDLLNELYVKVFNQQFLFHPEDYDEELLSKILKLAKSNQLI